MTASANFLGDDDPASSTSLSHVISEFGYPAGAAYDAPAAPELSWRYAFGLALPGSTLPDTGGVELCGRASASGWPPVGRAAGDSRGHRALVGY
jgi:hypothetical protein